MTLKFLSVGSWRRSGSSCSSVLSVGCLLLSLTSILTLCPQLHLLSVKVAFVDDVKSSAMKLFRDDESVSLEE